MVCCLFWFVVWHCACWLVILLCLDIWFGWVLINSVALFSLVLVDLYIICCRLFVFYACCCFVFIVCGLLMFLWCFGCLLISMLGCLVVVVLIGTADLSWLLCMFSLMFIVRVWFVECYVVCLGCCGFGCLLLWVVLFCFWLVLVVLFIRI